jgi:hypothetical protein
MKYRSTGIPSNISPLTGSLVVFFWELSYTCPDICPVQIAMASSDAPTFNDANLLGQSVTLLPEGKASSSHSILLVMCPCITVTLFCPVPPYQGRPYEWPY